MWSVLSHLSVRRLVKDNSRRQGGKLTLGVRRGPALKSAFSRRDVALNVSLPLRLSLSLSPSPGTITPFLSRPSWISPISFPHLYQRSHTPPPPKTILVLSNRFQAVLMYDLLEIDSPTRSWFVDGSVCDGPVSWCYLRSGGSGKCAAWGVIYQRSIDNPSRRTHTEVPFGEQKIWVNVWRIKTGKIKNK